MRALIRRGIFGLALGYALTRIGFADFEAVHQMFLLTDLRLIFTFGGAVALCFAGFKVAARGVALEPKPLHRDLIPGAVLFGAGWALTGACPGVVLVQLGAGQGLAVVTLVGLVLGNIGAQRWQQARTQAPAPQVSAEALVQLRLPDGP